MDSIYLFELYSRGPLARMPGGPLELKDYGQLKGNTLEERVESFFPSLLPAAREAMIRALA